MIGIWIEFSYYIILLALFILVFMRGSFTTLHRIYLLFHLFMLNWPLGQTVLYMAEEPEFRQYISQIMYVCLAVLGFGWYLFAVFLTGRSYILSRRRIALSLTPSLITVLLIMWNPSGLFVEQSATRLTDSTYGPLFWLLIAVLAGYMTASIKIMTATLRSSSSTVHLRKQVQMSLRGLILLLLFGFADIMVNVVWEVQGHVVPGLLSLGMTISGVYFVFAIQRNRVFDLVQFAQRDVINSMTTGIVVMNEEGIIADVNKAMKSIVNFRVGDKFDVRTMLSAMRAIADQAELFIEWHEANSPERLEIEVLVPSYTQAKKHIVIVSAPIERRKQRAAGRIVTVQDVTDYRLLMEETRTQNETLQEQNQELLMMQKELSDANQKLERMAVTDSLTGCYNRRYLMGKLESELPKLAVARTSFAILLFDIDLFKKVNDTYGHLAGDEVLVRTADTIRGELRPVDVLARYGGEEFTVYLPNANVQTAAEMAERIRRAVEQSEVSWDGCGQEGLGGWNGQAADEAAAAGEEVSKLSVTISMGVIVEEALHPGAVQESASYLRQLFASADDALYEAKNAGRNQVVCRKLVVPAG
ncbi:histidine kinase N-terminal 7TM domain-containing diguanylate cyclase [Paenibacillus kobensis]|uniref:histidine kinase N-terminal 7TM domain-containing diguanylate cyclase n=1 Tax=Paenibacillus kobensis TaxID=59841 RepID=UPI000FD9A19B|nr:diguanylate cyclase [Paenibacillus kobensis]